MNSLNSGGYPLHSSSSDVSIFFFLMLLYFSFLLRPGRPYQGRLPLKKYSNTCPIVSRSSLLDYSIDCQSPTTKIRTDSFVSIDTCITGCTCQVLAISVGNVLPIRVLVTLGKTKVDNEDAVFSLFSTPYQEVIWLDIPMNYSLIMNLFNSF